ncbi:hypothetical protein Tco_0520953 [Tanacetum coccineum]
MEEMMREWMARQMEAKESMKDRVVELEQKINQGLKNRQAIIENLERQFEFLDKKILRSESLPHTRNAKPRHKFVYKTPSIRNENDKGDVKFIEKDETQPIPIMPNPNPIMSNSPTVSPFLKDCTVHIPYTQGLTKENVFEHDEMSNHVGDEELNLIDGVGIGKMKKEIKKEIERNDIGLTKEPNKEWKWNEKAVPHNENVYHYQWHPNEISHLKRIIKES